MGACHVTTSVTTEDHGGNKPVISVTRCYYEYEAFVSLRILLSTTFKGNFFKKNHHGKKTQETDHKR
jgi:hypothetical protein